MKSSRFPSRGPAAALAALSGVAWSLTGCAARPPGPPPLPPNQAAARQKLQSRQRIIQTIRVMSPQQRAAYFKAHPEDARPLMP